MCIYKKCNYTKCNSHIGCRGLIASAATKRASTFTLFNLIIVLLFFLRPSLFATYKPYLYETTT